MKKLLQKLPLKRGENLKNIFSKEELNKLLLYLHNKHLEGHSITSFYNKYGITRGTVRNHFKRLNLTIINHQNKLRVREDLFNKIETEEDAYWLGFIYADGCISDSGVFSLDLKNDDREHLKRFCIYTNGDLSSVRIEQKASYNSFRCRYQFSGKGKELNKLGVVPRKSLILTFPDENIVSKKLQRHFIRGYFDGDGSCSIYKGKKSNHKHNIVSTILGTYEFLNKIKSICPIITNSFKKRGKIWVLTYNNRNADKFMQWLYKDASIFLERKHNNYFNNSPYIE